jgi:2-dehydro-3-deoxyphosphogluconate aldolase/(4S)-4-hydroxy-2-oxoglutarate aldolase
MTKQEVLDRIAEIGVVPVVRAPSPEDALRAIDAICEGGVTVLEITMTVPGAIGVIEAAAANRGQDVIVGAGTVLDAETAAQVIDAGAQFIVSPVYRRSLIEACHARGVAVTPGCFTPTEILEAWDAGADLVKVFPATALGPGYIKDVRAPLPQVKLMPTGGVTVENAGEWIKAGAAAVGVGSALLDTKAIETGDYGVLRAKAERIVANVKSARG